MEKYLLAPLLIGKLGQEDNSRYFFSQFLKVLAAICAVAALIVQKSAGEAPRLPSQFENYRRDDRAAGLSVAGSLASAARSKVQCTTR